MEPATSSADIKHSGKIRIVRVLIWAGAFAIIGAVTGPGYDADPVTSAVVYAPFGALIGVTGWRAIVILIGMWTGAMIAGLFMSASVIGNGDVTGICVGLLIGGWCGWYAAYHGNKSDEKASVNVSQNSNSSKILLVWLLSAVTVLAGCSNSNPPELVALRGNSKEMPCETIHTTNEFHELAGQSNVVLHIDVDWAVQAVLSRPVVARFKEMVERDPLMTNVAFRRIDCTEQQGELWDALRTWLRVRNADDSVMTGGYGAVLWIKDGRVVDSIWNAKEGGVDELVARTKVAFANKD